MQITLTKNAGTAFTAEVIPGTFKAADLTSETDQGLAPVYRTAKAAQGRCSIYLSNTAQIASLLTLAGFTGEGCITISGPVSVRNAVLNVTFSGEPPQAELVWHGQNV